MLGTSIGGENAIVAFIRQERLDEDRMRIDEALWLSRESLSPQGMKVLGSIPKV